MAIKPNKSTKLKDFLQGWKQGLVDIWNVVQEHNYKLFIKQVVVILVGLLILRWGVGKLNEQTKEVRLQIDAIRVQQNSEQDYLSNKRKLLSLEPQFPDVKVKDQWLLTQLLEVFQPSGIKANMNEPQLEINTNPNYVVISKKVSFSQNFLEFGKLLADIENRTAFLRVSEFSVQRNPDPNEIGKNNITMTFNTIFPKEKLAPVLFKDYNKGGQK